MTKKPNRLLSVLISLLFIAFGSFAQTEYSPSVKRLLQKEAIQTESDVMAIQSSVENPDQVDVLCLPDFEYGCADNDGFTDFALELIQNLNNGCADNTGNTGWSEYYTLGPALLAPGNVYNVSMASGYANQHVNIWVDYNDDLVLTSDEIILSDYLIVMPDTLYIAQITIPANAPPGQHAMRAMAVWNNSFNDPCGSYLYGEAEDYYVQVEAGEYGSLEGYVTALEGGLPIPNANIEVGNIISGTSGANGYYSIDPVLSGTWEVTCTAAGYNSSSNVVTIEEGMTSTLNFQLTAPQVIISPLTISVLLEPNAVADEILTIDNPGNGPLDWSAGITMVAENGSEGLFDLQFDWPVGGNGGEAGIECDGSYIYTSKWNGTAFHKYDLNGSYIESFTCGDAAGVRDMAYDGTYFYGAAANTTVFQMDFTNLLLVGQFTAPADIRAIAYNEDDNTFFGNNWDTDITRFDATGANLGSFPVGPIGASYYGFAYDNCGNGAPYLWGYAQTGNTLNELVQIQLPSGVETGLSFDVGSVAATGDALAGGLAITEAIIPGYYTLLGLAQDADIWGLELCESGPVWLTLEPASGSLPAGQSQDLILHINALDLIPGYYYAEIHFTTEPNVGSPQVDVTLQVDGLIPAANLIAEFECTDVTLTWEMPSGALPDSWNVYRNGDLIENVSIMTFTDPMVYPEFEYGYQVKSVYSGVESQPTATEIITVPVPANLEPVNPVASFQGNNNVEITWEMPEGCLAPDGYNIYRYETMIDYTIALSYTDNGVPNGFYEYYIRAVYYFGESVNSDPASVLVDLEELNVHEFMIFPNPASSHVFVSSPIEITNIKVIDHSGRLIIDQELKTLHSCIDVSNFESGIYFIKIQTFENEIIKKFTVH
jgi:hypothetical protein